MCIFNYSAGSTWAYIIWSSSLAFLNISGIDSDTLYGLIFTFSLPIQQTTIDWLCLGLTTRQPLWVILCRLPEKGGETENIVEYIKKRDREETGTEMKVKKQKK